MSDKRTHPAGAGTNRPGAIGLDGHRRTLSRQLRAVQSHRSPGSDGGVIRKIAVNRDQKRRTVGVAEASRSLQAFGGVLYSVAAVAHKMSTIGSDMSHEGQTSRMDVGDMKCCWVEEAGGLEDLSCRL